MKSPHLYASVWDEQGDDWVVVPLDVVPDDSERYSVQLQQASLDKDTMKTNFGLRLTSDQAARLIVALSEQLAGGKK